jgi:hypothetical protein
MIYLQVMTHAVKLKWSYKVIKLVSIDLAEPATKR